tara:strand:- start:199 stop:393 length:195 start_codon:yes stop_codon:yes gene_type:complete
VPIASISKKKTTVPLGPTKELDIGAADLDEDKPAPVPAKKKKRQLRNIFLEKTVDHITPGAGMM